MEQLFRSLPEVLKGLGSDRATAEAMVLAAWRRCAGEMLGLRTKPLEFFEKRLVIAVADETWRRHLEQLSPQMVANLNAMLEDNTVTFIEFRIDPGVVTQTKTAIRAEPIRPDPELDLAARAISDVNLRENFLQTAASCLNNKEHGR